MCGMAGTEAHEHCWHNIESLSAESGERTICCICADEL